MAIVISKRDKKAIYGASIFIILFIVLQFMILPVFNKRDKLNNSCEKRKTILYEMVNMISEYDYVRSENISGTGGSGIRGKGFTLFSFLDRLAGETEIKNKINHMKPSKVKKDGKYEIFNVEMKLSAVNMEQLSKYLYKIESSDKMVFVRRLSISKKGKDKNLIDVTMQVETIDVL